MNIYECYFYDAGDFPIGYTDEDPDFFAWDVVAAKTRGSARHFFTMAHGLEFTENINIRKIGSDSEVPAGYVDLEHPLVKSYLERLEQS